MRIKVYKLDVINTLEGIKKVGVETPEIKLPTYGKEGDSCMDVYPIYSEYDSERDRWIYHTGLVFAVGDGIIRTPIDSDSTTIIGKDKFVPNEMELRPRSNLSKSDFYVPNAPGTLDWGYRGELLMVFKNRTSAKLIQAINYIIVGMDRIALKAGISGEIKQYTSASRQLINTIKQSIDTPPYDCNGLGRCCQLIIRGSERIDWEEVKTIEELGATERGGGGFGSTGGAVK